MSLNEALALFEESQQAGAESYSKVIYYEDCYVGDIWCYGIQERTAMISIVIFERAFWGHGIATVAMRAFLDHVYTKCDLDSIGAFTYSANRRAIGVLENVGFAEINCFVEDGLESKYFEIRRVVPHPEKL